MAHICSFNTWEAKAGRPQQIQECLKIINNNNNLNSYLKKISKTKKKAYMPGGGGACFNFSTWEAKAGGPLQVWGQPCRKKEFRDSQDDKRHPISGRKKNKDARKFENGQLV